MKEIQIKLNDAFLDALWEDVKEALVRTGDTMQDIIREAQVIPRDMGTLQGEGFFCDTEEIEQGVIAFGHDQPQTNRLYYHPEYNFTRESWIDSNGVQHGGNVNARGLWFEPWQEGGEYEKVPQEVFDKHLAEILGGK